MVEDMIKLLEAKVQPSLRRGKHPDRDTARRIGTILRAVATDGHRLAREIDSPDPSRPLPYLRERPLV